MTSLVAQLTKTELKDFLDEKTIKYNNIKFIESYPIQIPHEFTVREDIEIAAFLVATIAWGNRKSIIKSSLKMMELLEQAPHDFIMNYQAKDLEKLYPFVHRTFNGTDFIQFIKCLRHIYSKHGGLEAVFSKFADKHSLQVSIHHFKQVFFELPHQKRTEKHVSDPFKNSAAKRINMFLRWMVRQDVTGVDFGIWTSLSPSQLSCPLDIHSGNVARKLKLIKRKQNDAKALQELDISLREFDSNDPVKYDFALFGLGVFEGF